VIPYGHQDIDSADIDAVIEVLRSDWLTQGPTIVEFEQAVARYCGARFAVAVNSGTSALHLSCLAHGLAEGDIAWTSPNTFVASANCARYCGATVDFVDIDPISYNICPVALKKKLVNAEQEGILPKILIAVHFSGQPCDMEAIYKLSKQYGFHIIEDASHAFGAQYKSKPIGACTHSDIAVFSFHPVKIITTAEGGVAVTDSESLYRSLCLLRSHGITRDPASMVNPCEGAWYYEQIALGYNYRLPDINAALGLSQIRRADVFIRRRRDLAARYADQLTGLPLTLPAQSADSSSSWHLYVIRLHASRLTRSRREIFDNLRANNIGVNVHYIPVHMQPYYSRRGFNKGDFPEAERYYAEAISLPLFPGLTEEQQDHVIKTLRSSLH